MPLVKHALLPWTIGHDGARAVSDAVDRASVLASDLATLPRDTMRSAHWLFAHVCTAIAPWIVSRDSVRTIDALHLSQIDSSALQSAAALLCVGDLRGQPNLLCDVLRSCDAFAQAAHELAFDSVRFEVVGADSDSGSSHFDRLAKTMLRALAPRINMTLLQSKDTQAALHDAILDVVNERARVPGFAWLVLAVAVLAMLLLAILCVHGMRRVANVQWKHVVRRRRRQNDFVDNDDNCYDDSNDDASFAGNGSGARRNNLIDIRRRPRKRKK